MRRGVGERRQREREPRPKPRAAIAPAGCSAAILLLLPGPLELLLLAGWALLFKAVEGSHAGDAADESGSAAGAQGVAAGCRRASPKSKGAACAAFRLAGTYRPIQDVRSRLHAVQWRIGRRGR